MKEISYRINNLELRKTGSFVNENEEDEFYYEIVKWNNNNKTKDSFCYTLLYFVETDEGWEIKFVGSRPFKDDINKDDLWILMEQGQKLLDTYYEENNA